jgi:hypothetical protein
MTAMGRPADRQARRDWWRRQIERQRNGSATVAEFCRQLGVSVPTFYYWKQRLHDAPRAPQSPASHGSRRPTSVSVASAAFVPVSIRESVDGARLEIELTNACVVRLHGTLDAKLLRTAIRAAGQLRASDGGGE